MEKKRDAERGQVFGFCPVRRCGALVCDSRRRFLMADGGGCWVIERSGPLHYRYFSDGLTPISSAWLGVINGLTWETRPSSTCSYRRLEISLHFSFLGFSPFSKSLSTDFVLLSFLTLPKF